MKKRKMKKFARLYSWLRSKNRPYMDDGGTIKGRIDYIFVCNGDDSSTSQNGKDLDKAISKQMKDGNTH